MHRVLGAIALAVLISACSPQEAAEPQATVTSYLSGTVTSRADSLADFNGWNIFVIQNNASGEPDTLGLAPLDSTGAFALTIGAEERGVYPLLVSNQGRLLMSEELAVADGDSGTVAIMLPRDGRPLRIRSTENYAWLAYRNTKAQHNRMLVDQLQQNSDLGADAVARVVGQSAAILWSLKDNFPGTIGGELAAMESITMLVDWNDSLAVARLQEWGYDNVANPDLVRATRRSVARLAGQDSALAFVRYFEDEAETPEQQGAFAAEAVVALLDSLAFTEAAREARAMQQRYADTRWASWASRALYEIENLRPGMDAPELSVPTVRGRMVSLDDFPEEVVLVEFYNPRDPQYQREIPLRNAIYEALDGQLFNILSISVDPDPVVMEAFLEGRELPGVHATLPQGIDDEHAIRYNVNILPARVLIDGQGKLIGKFTGEGSLEAINQTLTQYF